MDTSKKMANFVIAVDKIEQLVKFFDNLDARWEDEKEYEDFKDYLDIAKKTVKKAGFKFVSLKQNPLKLTFKDGSTKYVIRVKGTKIVVESYD